MVVFLVVVVVLLLLLLLLLAFVPLDWALKQIIYLVLLLSSV